MTYREAADILAYKNPLDFLTARAAKRREEAERLAIKVLIEKAEELEKAETANYKEI